MTAPKKRVYIFTAADLLSHLMLTAGLAFLFFRLTGRLSWAVMCVAGGILIDMDHFLDYGFFYGLKFSFRDFFGHGYLASGKTYLFFHSWELVALLGLIGIFFNILIPMAAGMALHLFTDMMISHRSDPRYLFLYHRWKKGFSLERLKKG